jgi:hypothetical protein
MFINFLALHIARYKILHMYNFTGAAGIFADMYTSLPFGLRLEEIETQIASTTFITGPILEFV